MKTNFTLLHTPDHRSELSFLLPNHPSQQALFQKPFRGEGIYLTIEVEDIYSIYQEIKSKKVPIKIDMRNESWGDIHFAIEDPNGIGVDIVQYAPTDDKS